MRVVVERYAHGDDSSLGRIRVPGARRAFTLEDEWRPTKKKAETRIPSGVYNVALRTVGGFHERYARRFPDTHKGMLWLRSVPGFEHILIHCGNDDDDTAGCILVGEVPAVLPDGEFEVLRSGDAYRRVYPPMADAAALGELEIEVRNKVVT